MSERTGALAALPGAARWAVALTAAMLLLGGRLAPASAQGERPSIRVAGTLAMAPATQAPFRIDIVPPQAIAPGSFVRIVGLPSTAALTGGHSIAPGAWAVPVSELPTLRILLPTEATGHSEVSITLVSADGALLAAAKMALVVTARGSADAGQMPPSLKAPTETAPPPGPPPLSAAEREHAMRLIKKGDDQMADGAVAQARLLYERAAEAGLALGAMSMASTYDPVELQRLGVRGIAPDPEAARKWYERALQLGALEARQRLQRLSAY